MKHIYLPNVCTRPKRGTTGNKVEAVGTSALVAKAAALSRWNEKHSSDHQSVELDLRLGCAARYHGAKLKYCGTHGSYPTVQRAPR